ncbi:MULTISPECIES: hypothetical protein [Methylobacterium]|uniref:Uncharacterized protein n=1 Tax=Methylobacterium fujisawaense TaxID=107400 RepID=A0ABR6DCT0_9HYPH|nr:hypothetical protein [Methylobacterium fujisawaense]MBA9063144.1 hypothetical protein [Methylobacterium fujisawaense]
MEPLTIRLHYVEADGRVVDARRELRLDQCGGIVPAIGDEFLLPLAVGESLVPIPRQLLTVKRRIFNPRDFPDYVALVCERRPVNEAEEELLP